MRRREKEIQRERERRRERNTERERNKEKYINLKSNHVGGVRRMHDAVTTTQVGHCLGHGVLRLQLDNQKQ